MKKLLIIFILLFLSSICYAQESLNTIIKKDSKIKRDYFDSGKFNIIDKNHQKKGYIKKDYFDSDRLIIYDKNHKKIGTIEQNYFDKDRWDIKEK